jgi:hypothetical protein
MAIRRYKASAFNESNKPVTARGKVEAPDDQPAFIADGAAKRAARFDLARRGLSAGDSRIELDPED